MTEQEASEHGFTHHGRMFSVPCWVTDGEAPMVAAKFLPFDWWILLCTRFAQLMFSFGFDGPGFPVGIGKPIYKE